ncbi:MAG: phosphotransferase [Ktedonobacteraceae bacterium]|nr:phosphotransferase [Ktedonobacteraceae bacterium]
MIHVSDFSSNNASFTSPFPVVHSILSPVALLTEILPNYDLIKPINCIFLARGVNDTYLVQTGTEKYILRVYTANWRSNEDILYELDLLLHLQRNDVLVSTPIAQRDGNYINMLHAPEGLRQVVLFTYAPGKALNRHDTTDSYHHGRAVATIHNATASFTSTHARASLDLSYLLDQSMQNIKPLLAYTSADWGYLQGFAERLRSQIEHFSAQRLDWGICHGDCHMLNDHISSDAVITFFDFDFCGLGWRAYDLAIVRWSEGFYKMDPDDTLWQAFLKGYKEQRDITAGDLTSISAFVALREIWHMALIVCVQSRSGMQGFDRLMQRTVTLLQEWEKDQF